MSQKRVTPAQARQMRALRAQNVKVVNIAAMMTLSRETVRRYAPRGGTPSPRVDNTAAREAFLASGRRAHQVALEIGWTYTRSENGKVVGDGSRLRRTLGLIEESRWDGSRAFRRLVSEKDASRIAEALGLLPSEIGL